MPYKSEKQRRFLHAKHPKIAAKWDREGAITRRLKRGSKKHSGKSPK